MEKSKGRVIYMLNNIHHLLQRRHKGVESVIVDLLDFADAVKDADLSDIQKDLLRKVYVEGFKQGEAAQSLGIVKSTASYHINSAIDKIAGKFS